MSYKVAIRKNNTGEVRFVTEPYEWHEGSHYWYTDGNMGCTSNRDILWEKAGGDAPEREDHVCKSDEYTLLYAELDDGSNVKLDGWEEEVYTVDMLKVLTENSVEPVFIRLNPDCKHGDLVIWQNIRGDTFYGELQEWDNGTAIILCSDGKTRAVRA